jgi:cytochrome c553
VPSAELPSPGTLAHNAVIGELVFFTGMGVDVNNLVGRDVRTLGTHAFRNRASDNNWSSCASCHYQGLTDNVTWIFATGPRSVISMDASYSKTNPARQRVFNWNAVQGSATDFNNNARGIQGGIGFTPGGSADATSVYNHGPAAGVSQALDLMTLWLQVGVRSLNAPSNLGAAQVAAGRQAFAALNCASCHGGDQWTTSAIRWNRPVFPNGTTFTPLDARVRNIANTTVITGFQVDLANNATVIPVVQRFTDAAGNATSPTLDLTNPIEIRNNAQAPVGAAGSFNPPSLLSLSNTGPYGHHGRAQTIEAVFAPISAGGLGHPVGGATPQQLADLSIFLRSIDGRTQPFGAPNATADN